VSEGNRTWRGEEENDANDPELSKEFVHRDSLEALVMALSEESCSITACATAILPELESPYSASITEKRWRATSVTSEKPLLVFPISR
jgi:hypothetical protein